MSGKQRWNEIRKEKEKRKRKGRKARVINAKK